MTAFSQSRGITGSSVGNWKELRMRARSSTVSMQRSMSPLSLSALSSGNDLLADAAQSMGKW